MNRDRGRITGLVEAPAFLGSAVTAWKWPWIAESVAVLTFVVIVARFNPWTISPFQKALTLEYAFLIAANVAFISKMTLRHFDSKDAASAGSVAR